MKLLVKRSDKIEVPVYVYEDAGSLNATHDRDDVPKSLESEELKFIFRRPTYQDSTSILGMAQATATTVGEEIKVDAAKFQNHILRTLLVDWTVTDEDGSKVECNVANVNSLDPAVARAAIAGVLLKIRL